MCIAIIVSLINIFIRKEYKRFTTNIFNIPMIILSIGFSFSVINAHYVGESFTSILQVIFIFILSYVALSYSKINENLILSTTIVTSVIVVLLSAFSFYGIDLSYGMAMLETGWGGRYTFGENEPNIAARLILQSTPIFLLIVIFNRNWLFKSMSILLFALSLYIIIVTASRSAILIFTLGVMTYLFFLEKMKIPLFKQLLLGITSVVLVVVLFSDFGSIEQFQRPIERYSTIFDINNSPSSLQRYNVIQLAFDYINNSPIIGVGFENSSYLTGVVAHNPLILMWFENGILGLLGFASIYGILIYYIVRSYQYSFFGDPYLMAFSVIAIMMVFGDMFMANSYKRFLWLPSLLLIVQFSIHYKNTKVC